MTSSYFITGTDTDVGKTFITEKLLLSAKQMNISTLGLKPIAAGCEMTQQGLRNRDACILQQASTRQLPYELINPFALAEPVSPHLAAMNAGVDLSVANLQKAMARSLQEPVDLLLIEGAGGWRVPINASETLSDWVKQLDLPVIIVVGIRLGCLNHAMLTLESIQKDGVAIPGWIANCLDPDMPYQSDNIHYLKSRLPVPLLACMSFEQNGQSNSDESLRLTVQALIKK